MPPVNVLIAPDKFKGSLTAAQASGAIRRGLERARPGVCCRELPIADGGEGTAEVLCAAMGGEWITAPAHDPLGRPLDAGYARLPGDVAVIAMSAASGLWSVPAAERDIRRATSFGTGELVAHAVQHGARKILLGLGGSATNDGGIGAAAAMGYRFQDADGAWLDPTPSSLPRLSRILRPEGTCPEIVAMCDVENPLLGPRGATWTYGPQKGGDAQSLPFLEAALAHLAAIVTTELGGDFAGVPGAGAAGGMGFGLMSFFGARLCSGFDTVAEAMGLEEAIAGSDLVVTGEGCLDGQTLEGKGPAGVALLARKLGKPVIAFAGRVVDAGALGHLFDGVFAIQEETMPLEAAMREAELLLEQKAARTVSTLFMREPPAPLPQGV